MGSCASGYCGTNPGLGPLPNDPDNNAILTAAPAFGGIDVFWTYPEINPQAVAYVNLYRSTNSNPATKVLHRKVQGDYFFDRIDNQTQVTYYYWIEIVSINGTVGTLIGPASAIARPRIEQYIELLTGKIDAGLLAQSLKEEIARIGKLETDLQSEANIRLLTAQDILTQLEAFGDDVDDIATLVTNEVQRLEAADTAQVLLINQIGAKANENAALISQVSETLADETGSLASQINSLIATTNNEFDLIYSAITQEASARTTAVDTLTSQLNTMQSTFGSQIAAIQEDYETKADAASARSSLSTTLTSQYQSYVANALTAYETATQAAQARAALKSGIETDYQNHVALALQSYETISDAISARAALKTAVTTEYQDHVALVLQNYETASEAASARATLQSAIQTAYQNYIATVLTQYETVANANSARANLQTTLQTDYNGKLASVNTAMSSMQNTLGEIGALWTAKVDVNGLIGGFGVYNSGQEVQAGFDVDTFWVGRTTNKVKPFIIEGSNVFINEAMINSLTFDKLRSASGDFIVDPGTGKIKAEYMTVMDLTVNEVQSTNYLANSRGWKLFANGDFELNGSVANQGRIQITNRAIKIFDANNKLRVQLGDLSA